MTTDDIVTRCVVCGNKSDWCECPEHQQAIYKRIAQQAMYDYKCAMWCMAGLSGTYIHPDYYKWYESKGKPSSKQLYDMADRYKKTVLAYIEAYGDEE